MIKLLEGFPDNVIAVNCSGHVTKRDYEDVLIPAVKRTLKAHEKARLYYRVGPEFDAIDPGAILEDVSVGISHLSRWERVAVITNVEWIRLAVRAFAFLIPGPAKFFTIEEEPQAREWIATS